MFKKSHVLLAVQLLLTVVMFLYLYARGGGLSAQLFWPILWAEIILSIAIIYTLPHNFKMSSLIILAISLSLVPMAALPEVYHTGRDDIFESQYAQILTEAGKWDPTLGVGFAENYYGYNPVVHFLLGFSSILTGLSTYAISKYVLFILIRLFLVLSVYLLIKEIVGKNRIIMIATFIFIGSAGMAWISVGRRTVASIVLVLAIYSMLRHERTQGLRWLLIHLLFSALLVFANHTIAYYYLLFMLGAWVYSMIIKWLPSAPRVFVGLWKKLLFFVLVFLSWEYYNRVLIFKDVSYFSQLSDTLLSGIGFTNFLDTSSEVSVSIYHAYELFLVYSVQMMFLFLGGVGLIIFMQRLYQGKKVFAYDYHFVYFALFGLVMYVFSAILMRTKLDVAVIIMLWFFSVPICILIAYFLEGIQRWRSSLHFVYVVLVMFLLFTGSLLMGMYTPRLTNRAPYEDVVIGTDMRSKTPELFSSAEWLSEQYGTGHVIGDTDVYEIYSGFFRFDVNTYPTSLQRLYSDDPILIGYLAARENIIFGTYAHTRYNSSVDYFVVNKAFSRHYSRTFGDPIPVETNALDTLVDKIYSNNEVMIYKAR